MLECKCEVRELFYGPRCKGENMNFKNLFYIGICALSAQGAWATEKTLSLRDQLAEAYGIPQEVMNRNDELHCLASEVNEAIRNERNVEKLKNLIDTLCDKNDEFAQLQQTYQLTSRQSEVIDIIYDIGRYS